MKHFNMKRILSALLVLSLMAAVAGCTDSGGSTTPQSTGGESTPGSEVAPVGDVEQANLTDPVSLTFASQDVGTGIYMYSNAIANLWVAAMPAGSNVDVTTTSPGGVGAPVVLENGDCDVVLANAVPARLAASEGILGTPATNRVRAIAGGFGKDFVNILFTQEFVDRTGITTMEELIEQQFPVQIAIKANGSFGEMSCEQVLKAFGLTYADIESWGGTVTQTGSDAIVSLLKDGKADMTIDHVGTGQAATTELCMTTDMYFPQLSDETLEKLIEIGYDWYTVPAGTWNGQTEEIKSVGSQLALLCSEDLSDELVYELTKLVCENKAELVAANANLDIWEPSTAWDPLKVGAPLHPGAEAYYREMGYLS